MSFDDELERAWALLEAGDESGARRLAEKLHGGDPGHPDVLLIQAACCRQTGAIEEALQLLEQAAQADLNWAAPRSGPPKFWPRTRAAGRGVCNTRLRPSTAPRRKTSFSKPWRSRRGSRSMWASRRRPARPWRSCRLCKQVRHCHPPSRWISPICLSRLAMWTRPHSVFQALVDADDRDADAWHGLGLCAEARNDEAGKRGLGCACWRWIQRSRWPGLSCRKRRWPRWLRPPCASCRSGCAS